MSARPVTVDALVYEGARIMRMRRVEVPPPGPGQVRVRVAYSGICGSELSGFLGESSIRHAPLVFGHEASGHVESLGAGSADGWGDVTELAVGDRVTINPLVTCGACRACLTGRQQRCARRALLGAHLPGTNAEVVLAPAQNVHPVPAELGLDAAATAEPAAFAIHAVGRGGARPTDSAVVIGAGPIGLLILQVLAAHGVSRRYVVERNPARLAAAVALGATAVDAGDRAVADAVRAATGGNGVALAIDAVGTEATRRDCVYAVEPGGRVVLAGLHADETSLPVNTVVRSEITLVGAFAYSRADFADALVWLADGRLGLREGVVSAPLAEGQSWYERLVCGDPSSKVLLEPGQRPSNGT